VAGVTSRCARSCGGSSRAHADNTARSGHDGRGRLTCRRNTPDLMPQYQHFGNDRRVAAREDRQPPEQAHHDQIKDSETHDRRSCPSHIFARSQVNPDSRSSGAVQGCSAGQITQTGADIATVDGTSGRAGSNCSGQCQVRVSTRRSLLNWANAPLLLTIANEGRESDRLIGASSALGSPVISGRPISPRVTRSSPSLP
jgi:hypothetical protein